MSASTQYGIQSIAQGAQRAAADQMSQDSAVVESCHKIDLTSTLTSLRREKERQKEEWLQNKKKLLQQVDADRS